MKIQEENNKLFSKKRQKGHIPITLIFFLAQKSQKKTNVFRPPVADTGTLGPKTVDFDRSQKVLNFPHEGPKKGHT